MLHSQQLPRILLLSADAWSTAEELAEGVGVSPRTFIEMLLINFRSELHNVGATESEAPESEAPVDDPRVVPISRARRRHRLR